MSARIAGKSWDNLRTDEQKFLLLFHVVVAGGGSGDGNGIGIGIGIDVYLCHSDAK